MKFLQINSFFSVGGPPRIVNGIYDTLKDAGHECKIAAARETQYAPRDSIQIGEKWNVYLNALSCRFFDDDGFRSAAATRKLIQRIEEYDPDVIHLHNLHGYYINIEILFSYLKRSGKKIFWTLHDCWAFTGHCPHFVSAGCDRWKTGCRHCPQKRMYPASLVMDNSERNFLRKKAAFTGVPDMTLVTPSQWLADLVGQSFLQEYPIEVRYNKVDTAIFRPTPGDFRKRYGLEGRKIVLGVAQNWSERKGLEDFIRLSRLLDERCAIVLVGLAPQQIRRLPKHILGLGRTNDAEELAAIYTAADVFLNLTYEDNFPTVNLESLACGTPVVTYRTGGSPEVLSDGCGDVADVGDVKQVAKLVCTYPKNTKRCLKRAEDFDRKSGWQDFFSLYKL